jgi:hypothetical protein|tara:strand:+ start:5254 stop:6147 length:894 start_codon:yes stop_codon:yes gene_type:complete
MADAAVESQVETEEVEVEVDTGVEEELPDFNIYSEESEESQVETKGKEPENAKDNGSWSARVKKDRQLRQRDIEYKRREQVLAAKEQELRGVQRARELLHKDPTEFLRSQGIDPLAFYNDWTERLASGKNEPGAEMRLSNTEKELKQLKAELQKRDQHQAQQNVNAKQQAEINEYYNNVQEFMNSSEDYPLTTEQCSPQDVANGIAAYYQKTGVELGFQEAFQMVEKGLQEKESELFNDPKILAKFKQFHGLEASKRGSRSQLTLSNNLRAQPTKVPKEEMSDEEIYDYWKGKLFTD